MTQDNMDYAFQQYWPTKANSFGLTFQTHFSEITLWLHSQNLPQELTLKDQNKTENMSLLQQVYTFSIKY